MGSAKKRRRAWLLFFIPVLLLVIGVLIFCWNICPRCFSTDTAQIQYGYFPPDAQAVANHEAVAGGCIVERSSPARYCFACESVFGLALLRVLCMWLSIPAAVLSALTIAIVLGVKRRKAKKRASKNPDTNPAAFA